MRGRCRAKDSGRASDKAIRGPILTADAVVHKEQAIGIVWLLDRNQSSVIRARDPRDTSALVFAIKRFIRGLPVERPVICGTRGETFYGCSAAFLWSNAASVRKKSTD